MAPMPDLQLPSNYRVSVKALIANAAGELLMVNEGSHHWDLPGGGLDHGETVEEALRRELTEELDLTLSTVDPAPLFVWTFRSKRPERGHLLWLVYKATVSGDPHLTPETTAFAYIDLDKLELQQLAEYFHASAFHELVNYEA
jgi:8-oxo-dGTP diphosphatase